MRSERLYLTDIAEAAEAIARFLDGVDQDAFLESELIQSAVLQKLSALGRRVRTLAEGPRSAGTHEVTLGAGLPAGTYVVRFETDGEAWTERVTVVR